MYGGNVAFDFVKIGDFNGDGAIDVAAGTSLQNLFTVFMNVGGTYVTTTSNNSTLEYEQPITFTATVTAGVIGSGTPTGTVNFFDSSTSWVAPLWNPAKRCSRFRFWGSGTTPLLRLIRAMGTSIPTPQHLSRSISSRHLPPFLCRVGRDRAHRPYDVL